ncbi:MAG TPA: Gldg family protein [Alphaproteobacteria bacterium]|nr:Gldg family protein [Alphaproteobacteria bacterium]
MNSAFGNIKAIAKRELAGYFSSPVAYVFIVIFLLLTGFFTFTIGDFFERGQANLSSFFMWHPWLYLFLVPCVGMRLWAEERRVGTIELLLTKPVTLWQAVLGKFLASWMFLGLSLALTFPVIITVNYLGSPDNGVIIGAYLGSLLMAGAYLAISCMTSAMTRNQVISFILSVVICLFLVLCGYSPVTGLLTRLDKPWLVDLVSSLSVMTHFQPFSTGLVDSQDVLFFLLIIAFALFANGIIIMNHQASSDRLMKRKAFERILYSTGGVAAMFVVMVSAYIVAGALKVRVDITRDREHTLSSGTKRILDSLDSRVTVRFYCTDSGNSMPPQLKAYAQRIEDMLHEYEHESKGHVVVEKLDPRPDSEAEDSARVDGVDGRPIGPFGSKVYMGIAVSLLDQKFVLPWLSPDRERLLEYDLSRAIDRVAGTSRPVVGVMTVLPVWGGAPDPLMRPGQSGAQEWSFITELNKDFTVRAVPMTTTNIDSDINVLLVADPVDISDTAQYAIDQFILRGGKMLAFLDPHAYFDQTHGSQNFFVEGDNAARSSLPDLLKAWGLDMNLDTVVADTSFASRNVQTGDSMPTLLLVTQDGINQTDAITAQMDNLVFPFAGAFTGKPADGLTETVLVKSSPNSALTDTLIASGASQQILENFKPSHIEYPLAVRLSGKFKTAFPNGRPSGDSSVPDPNQLKNSARDSEVVLVSDSDLLNDHVSVRVQEVMGHRLVSPMNGNLNFVQSLVEELAGDDNLISSRSRANMDHPFTRVKTMEAAAGKQLQVKVLELEKQQRGMNQKIKELQASGEGNQSTILSPDQQQELATFQQSMAGINHELEDVRGKLRKDTEALEFKTKVINIGAMPLLVALSGLVLAAARTRKRMPRKLPAPPIRILERPAAALQEMGAPK